MEAYEEIHATMYALRPVEELCAACQEEATVRVIVLPPAVVTARMAKPVHLSALQVPGGEDDDLALATWEDAEWQ